jgi:hypothetical protein
VQADCRNSDDIESLFEIARSESRFFPYGRRNPWASRLGGFAVRSIGLVIFSDRGESYSSNKMGVLAKSVVLFVLNWLDAQLTLYWVHSNIASEGNGLMAQLLNFGDGPFMLAKLAIGAFAALTLYRFSHLPIARRGMQLVLTVYVVLMLAHLATGLSTLGWSKPLAVVTFVTELPSTVLALLS